MMDGQWAPVGTHWCTRPMTGSDIKNILAYYDVWCTQVTPTAERKEVGLAGPTRNPGVDGKPRALALVAD